MGMPARGVAALSVAIRFASAPTIRCCAAVGGFAALRMRYTPCGCRSAHLVEVQPNFRLPEALLNAASASNAAFRTQSAAGLPSLAPHDSKARLQSRNETQGFMAKPCTPHLITRKGYATSVRRQSRQRLCNPQAEQLFKPQTGNVRGSRGTPLVLSLGGVRGIFSFTRKRISPLPRPHTLWQKQPPALPSILLIVVPISPTKNKRLRAGHKTQHLPDDWLLEH